MTNCEWTQKVSLLIDGELASPEARAVETHVVDCSSCRTAHEDFLLLRRRIGSYHADIDLLAQRRALRNILDAGSTDNPTVAAARPSSTTGRRNRFSEIFALPRLNPGLVAASALVLLCIVVGLLMLRRESTPVQIAENSQTPAAQHTAAGARENVNASNVAPTPAPKTAAPQRDVTNPAAPAPTAEVAKFQPKGPGGGKAGKFRPQGVVTGDVAKIRPRGVGAAESVRLPREVIDVPFVIPPRVDVEAREFSEAEAAANEFAGPAPRQTGLSAARHAEQAQQLLRSFRNAGAIEVADLSYERGRSQELLYQNIVLRREAARGGNASVESTLTQLEPILLDIANLSDRPASEDVRSIKNRMERKNIVAMLQVAARD